MEQIKVDISTIKSWLSDAEKIKNVKSKFAKSISDSNVDKYKMGFNADGRFKSFSANVYFGGYTGSHGNSSVYNYMSLKSPDIASEALVEYIKDHEDEVLAYISEFYTKRAVEAKDEAKSKLLSDLDLIKRLEQGVNK
jgi:hypothetical protein